MGDMQRKMRTEREGHSLLLHDSRKSYTPSEQDRAFSVTVADFLSGLGAFLESHQTKSGEANLMQAGGTVLIMISR